MVYLQDGLEWYGLSMVPDTLLVAPDVSNLERLGIYCTHVPIFLSILFSWVGGFSIFQYIDSRSHIGESNFWITSTFLAIVVIIITYSFKLFATEV